MTATFIKALAVVVVAACLVLCLSAHKPEYAFLLSLAGGGAVLIMAFRELPPFLNTVRNTLEDIPGSAYFSVALKALGISYLSEFAADTCRDFGQSSLAAKAEFAGKGAGFILCVPLVLNILNAALSFKNLM